MAQLHQRKICCHAGCAALASHSSAVAQATQAGKGLFCQGTWQGYKGTDNVGTSRALLVTINQQRALLYLPLQLLPSSHTPQPRGLSQAQHKPLLQVLIPWCLPPPQLWAQLLLHTWAPQTGESTLPGHPLLCIFHNL